MSSAEQARTQVHVVLGPDAAGVGLPAIDAALSGAPAAAARRPAQPA